MSTKWNGEKSQRSGEGLITCMVLLLFVVLLVLCAFVFIWRAGQAEAFSTYPVAFGVAGWYGPGFVHEPMRNGDPFNPNRLTFAMNRGYPDGQLYTITWSGWVKTPDGYRHLSKSGQTCAAWTDTGAFTELYGRVADLSPATMRALAGEDGFYYGLLWVMIEEGCLIVDKEDG